MKQEDKELLLIDLCERLPYGVIVKYKSQEGEGDVQLGCGNIGYVLQLGNGWWKECKPYLRPMSSMTEEEEKEFKKIFELELKAIEAPEGHTVVSAASSTFEIDFYNRHHFDYRGLIEKGVALEAPEGMYK